MQIVLTILITPLIILISIPLLVSAVVTSSFAFALLAIRVLLVYIELFFSVLRNEVNLVLQRKSTLRKPRPLSTNNAWRNSTTSSSGATTPRQLLMMNPIYGASTPLYRDFEGVGGWRYPGSDGDDEEALWTGMNSRLELPAVPLSISEDRKRNHNRSVTSLSAVQLKNERRRRPQSGGRSRPVSALVSGSVSPEETFVGDGRGHGRPRPFSAVLSGTVSSEEGFNEKKSSKSMLALGEAGMNVGKARQWRHRKSSSSSTGSSAKTLLGGVAGA